MASNYSEPVPVILRVKRKREEGPADTLVVPKVAKLDPSLCDPADQVLRFHLAATVPYQHQTNEEVLAQISKRQNHSSLVKPSSFSGLTISQQQEERREAKKALVSDRRFKLISKYRSLDEVKGQDTPPRSERTGGACPEATYSRAAAADHVHVYDLEQESLVKKSATPSDSDTASAQSRVKRNRQEVGVSGGHVDHMSTDCVADLNSSAITCNSSVMVREKVQSGAGSDYVYDLYYTRTCDSQAMMSCNWAKIYARSYEPELVHDIIDSDQEQCYEDEDDSNDESNWRNDYPDEIGSNENSSLEDSHEETFLQYRCREAYLGNSDEDESGYVDGSYWS